MSVPIALALTLMACGDEPEPRRETPGWQIVAERGDEALLAIGGRSSRDVYAVGSDKGRGPLALHFDGEVWRRVDVGVRGDLWWVFALPDGPVLMGGGNANILRLDEAGVVRMPTPGLARHTVYGIWGRSEDDIYAVGSAGGDFGFIWHYDGEAWSDVALPAGERPEGKVDGFFKVSGDGNGNVWVVGARGLILRSRDGGDFVPVESGMARRLFTVDARDDRVVAVGGEGSGALLEWNDDDAGFVDRTPDGAPILQGVALGAGGTGWAVGAAGEIFESADSGWRRADHGLDLDIQSLHAVWIDDISGVWAVGGNVLSSELDAGALIHRGDAIPAVDEALLRLPPEPKEHLCPESEIDPVPDGSIARRWNEQALGAIRRNTPHPGVHARNLFHLSASIWDAWSAYDPLLGSVFHAENHPADDVTAAREQAISHAAYGLLVHRYRDAVGGEVSTACFRALMQRLGYDPDDDRVEGAEPAAVGNRIAAVVIEAGRDDGANEANGYADTTGYQSINPALVVKEPGAEMIDPNIWQPLDLAVAVTQNGIPIGGGVQAYIGANWGRVRPFAMRRPEAGGVYHDPGPPPIVGPELRDQVVEVIRLSSHLDDQQAIDLSPGAMGNNPLGGDDGQGYPLNPVTGAAYEANVSSIGDFGRVLAEFWADGPDSETPPGHWNVLANSVADHPDSSLRLGGEGPVLERLEWDVKVYLALNGALHDAAIAAWEIKREYLTVRPISLVRHLGGLGQSSDPEGPSFHPDGLPLVDDLIEVVTDGTIAPGQRHAHLAAYVGEVAIRSWRGEPGDRVNEVGGVGWIRAVEWMPYQLRTFVTPAFPGFVSGHSTFSRTGAEVLTELTGSPFFPGGLGEYVAHPGILRFEKGPSAAVRLQWATYYDAADQAGRSRLWGGIHVRADDLVGRRIGSQVGLDAVAHARSYFRDASVPLR